MSEYEREVQVGFDMVCKAFSRGVDWAFYLVLFPFCYPMALLGRRERARIKRENESCR